MAETSLVEQLSTSIDRSAAFDEGEQSVVLPTDAPKKKPKPRESVGVGLNESNKTANAILVKLAAKMRRALAKGAKPGGPAIEKLRKTMLAINSTRVN
jgi:hypothetical protein